MQAADRIKKRYRYLTSFEEQPTAASRRFNYPTVTEALTHLNYENEYLTRNIIQLVRENTELKREMLEKTQLSPPQQSKPQDQDSTNWTKSREEGEDRIRHNQPYPSPRRSAISLNKPSKSPKNIQKGPQVSQRDSVLERVETSRSSSNLNLKSPTFIDELQEDRFFEGKGQREGANRKKPSKESVNSSEIEKQRKIAEAHESKEVSFRSLQGQNNQEPKLEQSSVLKQHKEVDSRQQEGENSQREDSNHQNNQNKDKEENRRKKEQQREKVVPRRDNSPYLRGYASVVHEGEQKERGSGSGGGGSSKGEPSWRKPVCAWRRSNEDYILLRPVSAFDRISPF